MKIEHPDALYYQFTCSKNWNSCEYYTFAEHAACDNPWRPGLSGSGMFQYFTNAIAHGKYRRDFGTRVEVFDLNVSGESGFELFELNWLTWRARTHNAGNNEQVDQVYRHIPTTRLT